ncbi:MAG: DegT/DnrJ/EryC1/StrS family aminotransferase [Chitinophagaceae bacterium]|nr:DegT/DnrJ/EryC1/StrS family aminotransferase [Chitinophagaceae bacterium]
MNIPFSPPYIDQEIIQEVVETLKSGWITTGPKVKALEAEVVKLTQSKEALCVNSWTSGAILMLKWFGVKEGDEVIIPAYTYSATALAVLHCGATPVMVDIKNDLTIDENLIASKITEKTKIIMPVDIAGWPCNYEAINDLVKQKEILFKFQATSEAQKKLGRILVISDAAHSIGARISGKETGVLTDITIFSFHAVKNITTAEGGVICLNLPAPFDNAAEYAFLRMMTLNGQTKDAFSKSKAGGWRYDIIDLGLKINMPDVCAAIGLAQIKKYDKNLLQERKRVFDSYSAAFSGFTWAQLPPQDTANIQSSYHLYALRMKGVSEEQRDAIIDEIAKLGVAINVHFIPMPMLTLFKNLGYKMSDYPNAFDNYSREISLPIYPQLDEEKVKYVIEAVVSSYNKVIA